MGADDWILIFLSLSLAIPQFELLSHISSFRLSSGHSGLVLTLSMQPVTPCSAPTWWLQTGASGLLLHWELWLHGYSAGFIYLIFPSQSCCPLRFQNSPQTCWWEGFLLFGNFSSFTTYSPGWVSVPNSFVSLFLCIFCPTSFWRQWAAILGAWCPPPVFRGCFVECAQCSNDLRWICGGESGLPVLFLHHLLFIFYNVLSKC